MAIREGLLSCFISMCWALEEHAKVRLACNLIDALCGCVAKREYSDKIHMAIVRSENRFAIHTHRPKMRRNIRQFHDFMQGIRIALFVEVGTIFIANFIEFFNVEKLRERLLYMRTRKMGVDDLVAAGPISRRFHFNFLSCGGPVARPCVVILCEYHK